MFSHILFARHIGAMLQFDAVGAVSDVLVCLFHVLFKKHVLRGVLKGTFERDNKRHLSKGTLQGTFEGHTWHLQVVTAEGLTIRVINNVSKRMEVKPRFHEAFQKEGCPDAFPYRQKVQAS